MSKLSKSAKICSNLPGSIQTRLSLLLLTILLPTAQSCANPDTLFTPFDNGQAELRTTALLHGAQHRIRMSCYAFTDYKLVDELVAAVKRGVDVSILADKSQSSHSYEKDILAELQENGVKVLIGTSPVHGQLLHAKFLVVDTIHTEDGSWNYTGATATAQFNTLNFSDDPGRAAQFEAAWQKMHDSIVSRAKL